MILFELLYKMKLSIANMSKYLFQRFCLIIWFLILSLSTSKAEKNLVIYFLNVKQADSAFIITPNNRTMLIDAGITIDNFDTGEEIVIPFIEKLKVKEIDVMIASHPHMDHVGGLISVMRKIKTNTVLDSGFPYPSSVYHEFLSMIAENNINYKVVRGKSKLYIDPDLTIIIFHPPKELKFKDANNNSIVMKITYGKISILFTGDLELEGEKEVVKKYGSELESQILKSPHHGSSTSSSPIFLKTVKPEVVIISCGKNNLYGHPHDEVIKRYKSFRIKIYRTDINGTIQLITNGKKYKIKPEFAN